MKLAIVVLACMAAVAVQSTATTTIQKPDKQTLLRVQTFLFEVLRHLDEPLMYDEWIKYSEQLIVDKTHYTVYDDRMIEFYETYKVGGLLPQGDFFSAVNKYHVLQAWGLFDFFYQPKDIETFIGNVAWARVNVNPGMFVYALTLAVIHRPDMQGIILPSIYEIFPQMFFNTKLIMEVEKFDWELWNKQIMNEKQWISMYEKKHIKNVHGRNWYMKDWKMWQWWKLMGLDEKWYSEKKYVLRENTGILQNDPKWTALWSDLHMVWTPVDYTRDIDIMNEESKLSYFTEDLGWNAYWYYLNMDYALILGGEQFHLNKDRRGEWWIFNVQQMLARYYMERLSNGLGDIEELSWHGIVDTGYDPELIAYNGIAFTMRQNYFEIDSHENVQLLNRIKNIDRRIDDAIASGKFVTQAGVSIDLRKPESIEYIGNMMQGNIDTIDKMFFGNWLTLSSVYLSGSEYHDMTVMPSTFLNYETMLRDPLYYHLMKKSIHVFISWLNMLLPYKHSELLFDGVTINDVKVDKMMTYFDLVDFDVTTMLNEFSWDKMLLARQMRLNHKPYNIEISVSSTELQDVVVRTFLGPDFDEFGQKINQIKHRENLMQIDEFTYSLKVGDNMIKRSSQEYSWTVKDRVTYTELYHLVQMANKGEYDQLLNISEPHCEFPQRLVLPKGWVKGLPMKLFVMITPYKVQQQQHSTYDSSHLCGIGSGTRFIDDLPFGYPFDREINHITEFTVPNMFWKDVKIYHVDKFEKYSEHKYEHFGSFDYNIFN